MGGWSKKGQFFLIATFIVIVVIVSLAAFVNYSRAETYTKIDSLKDELKIESEHAIDYGIYNKEDMDTFIKSFTDDFAEYVEEDIALYFLFGEKGNLTALKYYGGSSTGISFLEEEDKATLYVGEDEYEFDLKPGQNFYYVISQSINGERYVRTS
jgi:hypothetical protein